MNEVYLKEPYNPTDPIVVFDPEIEKSKIVVRWNPQSGEAGNAAISQAVLKEDAIRWPLIKLNTRVLDKQQIKSFKMEIKGFLPTIELDVYDYDKLVQGTDVPGMNNVITVIITAPVNGASRKISCDFYIDSCEFNEGIASYKGELKLLDLKKAKFAQIGDKALTTYEFLKKIAKDCKLGFATTEKCSTVKDERWRQIYSQNYKEYIEDQIAFGGLDEYSVFDAWVDQYGYLIMVNLPYIFNENVDPLQLTTQVTAGETNSDDKLPDNSVHLVNRMITNNKNGVSTGNLYFENYESVVDNSKNESEGTLKTLWYLQSPGEENKISSKQIQVIEDSIDGVEGSNEYEFETSEFIGVEMSDTPILIQKEVVKSFRRKKFAKQLYIEMVKPNYALQRGQLIQVLLEEYEPITKKMIMDNYSNATSIEKTELGGKDEDLTDGSEANITINDSESVTNPALSGLYYINCVGFKYSSEGFGATDKNGKKRKTIGGSEDILQYMYLVRKDLLNNITNKYTAPKI